MTTYVALIRGVNVGGKNKLSMATLKQKLLEMEFRNVATYIASGNVVLQSDHTGDEVQRRIETMLPKEFALDSELIKVHVLTVDQFQRVVASKPNGFGEQPELYLCDVIFLMNVPREEALNVFRPREGVDEIWPGEGVVYSRRLAAERTKSRLSSIIGTPVYKSMTIRNWNTTVKLLEMAQALE